MRFTDRSIRNIKPKDRRYEVWEGSGFGFGILINTTGTKTWIYRYRANGKYKKLTLGRFPEIGLAAAREKHREARQMVEEGADPSVARQQGRYEASVAPTIQMLAERYIKEYAKPRKRSWKEDHRVLDKDVLPFWKKRRAADIKKAEVRGLLKMIVDRGSPIGANRTLEIVRRMFNWAVEEDILENSPCIGIKRPAPENQKDRVLSEEEIRQVWLKLPETRMTEPIQLLLKLMLLTDQRKGEVVGADWSEFDLAAGWWTIPAARSKNKLAHRVPLSPQTVSILDRVRELSGDSQWLFPGRGTGRCILGTSPDHAVKRALLVFDLRESFTPHDLRRTAASHMTGMGISRLVVSKILNHAEAGVTAVYDRHSYDEEKRQALYAWGMRVEEIVSGQTDEKVVDFIKKEHAQ
ncbi:MAG: tyrosine-type recombinase/integrase [Magnetococcales bacterium]|nr:tyrosine-type recombinase/integrase [Magnetococcales bacterium]